MDRICMPCCTFQPVDKKQAYVDSTHLNNSDKLCRIIYGADKIHIIIYLSIIILTSPFSLFKG